MNPRSNPAGVVWSKNLSDPDEVVELPGIAEIWVELGGYTVGKTVQDPGWRWSRDTRPLVGGDWCEARHVGLVLSGRWGAELREGTILEFGPNDVYDCPPGHDGYTIGDEQCVMIEWSGLRTFAAARSGFRGRVLCTLLFTDLVDSTVAVARLGDWVWRERLERHFQLARAEMERNGGRQIATTGDGLLAVFDGPARALESATTIRDLSEGDGLPVRIGVHVGEVEIVEGNVHGLTVHEAARILQEANRGEVIVSEIARILAEPAGFQFEDRGEHSLKGVSGQRRLFALVGRTPASSRAGEI
jgi:class 3 adenylate cyclase